MYFHKTPKLLEWLYPSLTWHKSRKEETVYLTFDDGPVPNATDFVLDTLKSLEVKATFFCVGDNIRKHRSTYEKVLQQGHRVGNHTFNHMNGWKTDADTYLENFRECAKIMDEKQDLLFRPPYGTAKRKQLTSISKTHEIIMWDVLSGDFDPAVDENTCLDKSLTYTKAGSIIIFHDSNKTYKKLQYVLPRYIEQILKRGFSFGLL
jgi:peptidoglycan/xylan/chitin deacetylase (PgdA/CDA1 family)